LFTRELSVALGEGAALIRVVLSRFFRDEIILDIVLEVIRSRRERVRMLNLFTGLLFSFGSPLLLQNFDLSCLQLLCFLHFI
jgi:hypothetical protein